MQAVADEEGLAEWEAVCDEFESMSEGEQQR